MLILRFGSFIIICELKEMEVLRYRLALLLGILLFPVVVFAQYAESLDADVTYRDKMMQIDSLKRVQTGLVSKVSDLKRRASADQGNKLLVDSVLNFENKLFEIRSSIGRLTSECQAIEQEYIIRDLNSGESGKNEISAVVSYQRLVDNKFFRDNLSKRDFDHLLSEENKDDIYFAYRDSLFKSVDIIQRAERLIRSTSSGIVADSLFIITDREFNRIKKFEDELSDGWRDIFEKKIDVYAVLLDKLNVPIDTINELNNRFRDIQSMREEGGESKLSPIFYSYPMEKSLILSYEKNLAEKLAYTSSLDSIKVSIKRLEGQRFEVNKIDIPRLQYVNFSDVSIGGKGEHSKSNIVKEVQIPSIGSIYTVRIYVLKNQLKYIGSLKRVNPVSLFRSETGMYEYHAGVYKTRDDAKADEIKLARLGFKTAVVEWRKGGKVNPDGVVIPINVFKNKYRVAFDVLSDDVKKTLGKSYSSKPIVKINNRYSVGYFNNYLDAVRAQKVIGNGEIVAIPK